MAAGQGFVAVVGARVLPESFASQVSDVVGFFLSRGSGIGSGPPKETPPMKEQSIIEVEESRPAWEVLEAYAREGIRRLLQQLLEEEMEEVLAAGAMSGGTSSPTSRR